MKLSIIIPVYDVEATLNQCVESVVTQDYNDFELLLIDDGSLDKCPQICDRWASKDKRIRVVHQKNGGLSDARNTGIELAQGDYITFIDSDDYIGANTLSPLMNHLKNYPQIDILEYPAFLFFGSPKQEELSFPEETVYHDAGTYWYECHAYRHSYAWNKIYKKKLFRNVRYPTGVVFEDVYTLYRLLNNTSTIATINSGRYYYCYNPRGITATADGPELRMLLQHHVGIIQAAQRRDPSFQTYYLHVVNIQIDVYEATGDAPILPYIHLTPSLFKGIAKLKAITLNKLGINKLCESIHLLHKIWKRRW